MVDISKELDKNILNESFSSKRPHLFNDDRTTFKQLKELFTNVFDGKMMKFSKKVPSIDVYLTTRDGDWYVSSYLRPKEEYPIGNAMKLRETEGDGQDAIKQSLDRIVECMKSIDPMLLNRYFANGNNRMHIKLICPPDGCSSFYNGSCFGTYNGIDCFSKGKKIGNDKKTSFELFKILKVCPSLNYEFSEVTPDQLTAIKACNDENEVLKQLINRLSKFIDGLGWGCSIHDYIQDRYSRYLVNKALEYGLDVSRNGSLVSELASRLSGTSSLRPTKSDLVTFAKREGIDVKSDNYKAFLDDVENNAQQTNSDIMLPIEKVLYFALANAACNVLGYASIDPNPKAKKFLHQIASDMFYNCKSIDDCAFDASKLDAMKKALAKICTYKDIAPKEVRVMNNGTPYSIACECEKFDKMHSLIG